MIKLFRTSFIEHFRYPRAFLSAYYGRRYSLLRCFLLRFFLILAFCLPAFNVVLTLKTLLLLTLFHYSNTWLWLAIPTPPSLVQLAGIYECGGYLLFIQKWKKKKSTILKAKEKALPLYAINFKSININLLCAFLWLFFNATNNCKTNSTTEERILSEYSYSSLHKCVQGACFFLKPSGF